MTATPTRARRSPGHPRRSPGRPRRLAAALLVLLVVAASGGVGATPAAAQSAPGTVDFQVLTLGATTQPSGSTFSYVLQVSCTGSTSASCDDLAVTVPLPAPIGADWTWSIEDDPAAPLVVGSPTSGTAAAGSLTFALDDVGAGSVRGFLLHLVPPNLTTPDGTTWTLTPELAVPGVDEPLTGGSVSGTATAETDYYLWKNTVADEYYYASGSQMTFQFVVTCFTTDRGSLHLESATLTDPLPAGMTFVSASHGGTFANGVVTWDLDRSSLPASCGGDLPVPTFYELTVEVATVDGSPHLTNVGTFVGTGIGGEPDEPFDAPRAIYVFEGAPPVPTPSKGAFGPLPTDTLWQKAYTFAGNWIDPPNHRPTTTSIPDHEASFHLYATFGVAGFETELADPLPCLDDFDGTTYTPAPAGQLCANPAFHPTMIALTTWSGLAPAYANGFRPELVLTNGTVVPLDLDTTLADGGIDEPRGWFAVPAQHVGQVAEVRVPRHPDQRTAQLGLQLYGHVDASVAAGQVLENRAEHTAWWQGQGDGESRTSPPVTVEVVPAEVEGGIVKRQTRRADGTVNVQLDGTVVNPLPGADAVTIVDLLPAGYAWSNPPATVPVSIHTNGVPAGSFPGDLDVVDDFGGSGRTLVRIGLPAPVLGGGSHRFAVQFVVDGPEDPGTYVNEAKLFVDGPPLRDACAARVQAHLTPTYATGDPGDLDGDGAVDDDPNCVATDTLIVPGAGPPAFNVTKTVQGDLDEFPAATPMVGNVSAGGGTATYRITWTNVGSGTLTDAVVYDVLSHAGDVGTSTSEASTPRGSDFATTFVSAGPLPAGVTIEYSGSTDPCRSEVNPAADATCTDDWTTDPDDLGGAASVRALRLRSVGPHVSGGSFSVAVEVTTPAAGEGDAAWNSVAGSAHLDGQPMLATESPLVGLQVPTRDDIPLAGWRALALLLGVGLAVAGAARTRPRPARTDRPPAVPGPPIA